MAASASTHTTRGVGYPGLAGGKQARRALRGLEAHSAARTATIVGLFVAMAAGSVGLWTAAPVAVLWVVSRLSASSGHLSIGICLAVAVGVSAAMVLGAAALARLDEVYMRITGVRARTRVVPGWRRSLSDSDSLGPSSVLEKLAVAFVLLAVVFLATWFVAFAGSSLPS